MVKRLGKSGNDNGKPKFGVLVRQAGTHDGAHWLQGQLAFFMAAIDGS